MDCTECEGTGWLYCDTPWCTDDSHGAMCHECDGDGVECEDDGVQVPLPAIRAERGKIRFLTKEEGWTR